MNAQSPPAQGEPLPKPRRPRRQRRADLRVVKARRADQEFLPAALEILETPPSPVRLAFIVTICALVVAALAWAFIGRIDIVAIAQGKIQPTGRVKVVQPVETGKVIALNVANGDQVIQGQVLLELDAGEAKAEAAGFAANLVSARAEMARRRAALAGGADPLGQRPGAMTPAAIREGAGVPTPAARPAIAFPPDTPEEIRWREEKVLAADLEGLAAAVASLDAQRRQKQVERQRLAEVAAAQQALVSTLKERVDMRSSLLKTDSGNKASVIDAMEQQQYHQTVLVERRGQLLEAEAAAEVLARDIDKTIKTFLAENSQKLSEAERNAEDLEQKLARAQARLRHMTLTAPISGTVQALAVNSPGQVVTTGQEIMRLIPADAALEIEAYLLNKDIGFVSPGQQATIKIESFPFTRYGTIDATVTKLARDAIPEPDARQIEGDPARPSETKTFAGAQRTQNLVFPVTLTPARTTIEADGALVPLQPGMAVSVEVKTGSRRIIDYVFSPLVEVTSEAGRER